MRVAVTGASGFVGRAFVAGLRAASHDAIPVTRAAGANYGDALALARAFEGADAVVHLAARAHQGGADALFESNVHVTRAVAQAARDAGVRRFVNVSSIGVNGNVTHGKPFDEDDAPAPVEAYARSKWKAEQKVHSLLMGSPTGFVIVRPPLVYGPDAPGNMGKLVRAVRRGVPLPLASVRNRRSLVGIENLVDFLLVCLDHPAAAGELFLVADREEVSTPDIIRAIARGLGRPARLWPCPQVLLEVAAAAAGRRRIVESLCHSLQVDASKAQRVLGWSPPVRTQTGIERAAAAWRIAP
jgi:nucleoside-diphosphate-sugar epimerase